jgi:hypothetical protein
MQFDHSSRIEQQNPSRCGNNLIEDGATLINTLKIGGGVGGHILNIQINLGDEPTSSVPRVPRVIDEAELMRSLPPDYGSGFVITDESEAP